MNVPLMLGSHPYRSGVDLDVLATCITSCFECAQACTACADACLAEDMVADLRRCIRTNLDCADICLAAARVLSRQTETTWDILRAQVGSCYRACQECAMECGLHSDMHKHCQICAEACRRCEDTCAELLKKLEKSAILA